LYCEPLFNGSRKVEGHLQARSSACAQLQELRRGSRNWPFQHFLQHRWAQRRRCDAFVLGILALKADFFTGKSNILDAICFVFCLDMQSIRIKSFSQLVHTGPSHTGESTFVRVIFSSSDGEELAFEREIVVKDTETDGVKDATTIDRVDGTRLKLSDYVLNLKEIGIDPEAKNFLVQQVVSCSLIPAPL
jgi:hypothetical protein